MTTEPEPRVYHRILCQTCGGDGKIMSPKQTIGGGEAFILEHCKPCKGGGWIPWHNKPWAGRPEASGAGEE
jgi:DnaJ-class molecular chaperone